MAGFRGFGDDAMKVAADQRQHAAQMAQIAAQERASQRSASVALAGQAENARQADMQLQARKEELQAGRTAAAEENAAQRSFAAGQADLNRAAAAEEGGAQRAFQAEQAGLNRAEASAARDQDNILRERQLAINESTFARMKEQWELDDAAKAEFADQGNAATLAAMRLVAGTRRPAPPAVLNSLNLALGVKTGEPGSYTGLFPISDDQDNVYGWGATQIDNDGKTVEKSIDPADKLPIMRKMMGPQAWETFDADVAARGKDDKLSFEMKKLRMQSEVQDRVDARHAADNKAKRDRAKYAASVSPQRLKQLEQSAADLDATIKAQIKKGQKPNDADVQRLDGITKQLDAIAQGTQDAQDLGVTPTGGNGASISGENVTITLDGQTKTVKDSPALRKWLSAKGISIQ